MVYTINGLYGILNGLEYKHHVFFLSFSLVSNMYLYVAQF